jgi:hypothetical protein
MMKSIRFTNAEITMAGNLFLPENFNESACYPAIVVVHRAAASKNKRQACMLKTGASWLHYPGV